MKAVPRFHGLISREVAASLVAKGEPFVLESTVHWGTGADWLALLSGHFGDSTVQVSLGRPGNKFDGIEDGIVEMAAKEPWRVDDFVEHCKRDRQRAADVPTRYLGEGGSGLVDTLLSGRLENWHPHPAKTWREEGQPFFEETEEELERSRGLHPDQQQGWSLSQILKRMIFPTATPAPPEPVSLLWISDGPAIASTHRDVYHNFNATIAGQKRFFLAPLTSFSVLDDQVRQRVRLEVAADGQLRQGTPLGWMTGFSPADLSDPSPSVVETAELCVAETSPGDVLYIPPNWLTRTSILGQPLAAAASHT